MAPVAPARRILIGRAPCRNRPARASVAATRRTSATGPCHAGSDSSTSMTWVTACSAYWSARIPSTGARHAGRRKANSAADPSATCHEPTSRGSGRSRAGTARSCRRTLRARRARRARAGAAGGGHDQQDDADDVGSVRRRVSAWRRPWPAVSQQLALSVEVQFAYGSRGPVGARRCCCRWSAATGRCTGRSSGRCATRSAAGRLLPGTALPSTRALARELGVSRGVVFEAYGQLAAEGYLVARQGAATRVAERARRRAAAPGRRASSPGVGRYDLLPGRPDLAAFPRDDVAGGVAAGAALGARRRARLPRPARGGRAARRAERLPRPRAGGRARPAAHGRHRRHAGRHAPVPGAARARATRPLAVEDPGFHLHRVTLERAGLRAGRRARSTTRASTSTRSPRRGARAVLVTPAHQMPTGVVLSPRAARATCSRGRTTSTAW